MAVTSFEATNTVLKTTDENNSFSISTPGYYSFRGGADTIKRLQSLLKLPSRNIIELHVKEIERNGLMITEKFSLFDVDTHEKQIFE